MQQDQSLSQEVSRLWDEVFSSRYDFTHREAEVEVLRGFTLEELVGFYESYLAPGCKGRRKLSIHVLRNKVVGDEEKGAAAAAAGGGEVEGSRKEETVVAEAAAHVHHQLGGKHAHQQHQQQHPGADVSKAVTGEVDSGMTAAVGGGGDKEMMDLGPVEVVESLEVLRQQLASYARVAH